MCTGSQWWLWLVRVDGEEAVVCTGSQWWLWLVRVDVVVVACTCRR